ncbi:MAG: hypothetical protein WBG32_05980 [Nodosilinea sp.]
MNDSSAPANLSSQPANDSVINANRCFHRAESCIWVANDSAINLERPDPSENSMLQRTHQPFACTIYFPTPPNSSFLHQNPSSLVTILPILSGLSRFYWAICL